MASVFARRCKTLLGHLSISIRSEVRCASSGMNSHTASMLLNINTSAKEEDEHRHSGVLSQRLLVNDVRLHFKVTGTGDHTVLLLPGALGCTSTDFRPQLSDLDKDLFTVIAWDPRGYGKSIPPEREWPLMFYHKDAEDAVALMKAIGKKKFSMLGWSDGGNTAMIIAARHPEMVRKMVVWGANSYVTERDVAIFEGIRSIDRWSEKMRAPFEEVYGEEYFRRQWSQWVTAFLRFYHENNGDIFKTELANIRCPTMIIHGEKDPMVLSEHPQFIHENIKGSKLVTMPEGKHNLHLRFADQFNYMVTKFLSAT